ncbi:MAG: type II toxin-antitoxin system RelE family toxin [Thermoplasmatota archaeon]
MISKTFKVLVLPELLRDIPPNLEDTIKASLKELKEPYPGQGRGDKKLIQGASDVVYRMRIGDYRAFYRIEKEERCIYVFDILTAEAAHKKYGRL